MKTTTLHDSTIQQLIQWATNRETVRAMLLTSSFANPHAVVDRLSDYDVILVVRDVHPFFTDRSWLQDSDYGFECVSNVIQFADGLKIDFTLWPIALMQQIAAAPALPDELDAGYIVLLDKDHLTAGMASPTYRAYIPTPPTDQEYQKFIEEFFSDAPYVAKCLWRDELLPAKWCLDYDMKHVYLRPLLEWRVAIENNWSRPAAGALGKGLKKKLSPDLWAQLESCYAGAAINDNWNALYNTMAFFGRIAREVGAALGYTYPAALEEGVTAFVRRMQQIAHERESYC
jgi:aminoglycoside 6-adenylyltransferase